VNLATLEVDCGTLRVRPHIRSGRFSITGSESSAAPGGGAVMALKSFSISALVAGVSGEKYTLESSRGKRR
jgi:hypothetical protein